MSAHVKVERNDQVVNSSETEAQLPRFLDHQLLSSFGDLIQSVLANMPLGYGSTLHKRPSHWINMQNTLGYDSTPRIEKKCSGENILGLVGSTPQKHPSYWTNILGGLGQKGSGEASLVLD